MSLVALNGARVDDADFLSWGADPETVHRQDPHIYRNL